MTAIKSLAVITGLLLVMSTLATSGIAHALPTISFTANTPQTIDPNGSYVDLDHDKARTQITMDPLPGCSDASRSGRTTCTAAVFAGDDVKFSGKLMTADGEGIAQKSIKIYSRPPPGIEFTLLTSTVTGTDGSYEVVWNVKLPTFKQTYQETVKKRLSQPLVVFAVFEGNEKLAYAKSTFQAVTIMVKDLITTVKSDKTQYAAGETAVIFIGFFSFGDFIDPTVINAFFDGKSIVLEKKKEGSYVFITPSLTKEHHQLAIMPQKEGFNANGAFYTIIVEGLR